jgi:hypothetical protein
MKLWALVITFCLSCASPTPEEKLKSEYITLQGSLASPPVFEDGDNRMVLFLHHSITNNIIVCIAVNEDNERLLQSIATKITAEAASEAPIMVYGKSIETEWNEYVKGVDLEVYAIGFFSAPAQKYQIIYTNYGSRATDAFKGISWTNFLRKIGEKSVDLVL